MKRIALVLSVAFCLIFLSTAVFAGKAIDSKSLGQTVYVPAACHINTLNQLVITRLVIRNTDPAEKITVTSVAFYDPDGNWVKEFLGADLDIESWSAKTFSANPNTIPGSHYPNEGRPCFIVKWEAVDKVIPPIITSAIAIFDPVEPKITGLLSTGGKVIEEK